MKLTYDEIIHAKDIESIAKNENVLPVNHDEVNRLLICIDVQNDFMDNGALGVPGALKDVENLTKWIYNNVYKIANIVYSLDTHTKKHIFFHDWWKDEKGNLVEPFTIITYADVLNGKYSVVDEKNHDISLEYLKAIEANGKQLCIWPYHCIQNTEGAKLEKSLENILKWYSVVREKEVTEVVKGLLPDTEMYGIIHPEYNKVNYFNYEILNRIENADEVYIAGEAASHCLLESLIQILDYFKERINICKKIVVLTDTTSPIGGYEEYSKEWFKKLVLDYGISLKKTTDLKF